MKNLAGALGVIVASGASDLVIPGDPFVRTLGEVAGLTVGAIIGSRIEKWPKFERLIMRYGGRLEVNLFRKMLCDFRGSILTSNAMILESQRSILHMLIEAGTLPESRNDPRIPKRIRDDVPYSVPSPAFWGVISQESIDTLRNEEEIVVDSQSIHLGMLATLEEMISSLEIPIRVINSARQGADQLERINSGDEVADFVICADANMFLLGGGYAKRNYRFFAPCFWQPQFIVKPKGTKTISRKRIIIAEGSSAQEQYRVFKERFSASFDNTIDDKPTMVSMSSVADVYRELEPSELMICWDPVISNIHPYARHEIFESELYKIGASIYCHRRWNDSDPKTIRLRNAFLEVLVGAWNTVLRRPLRSVLQLATDNELKTNLRKAIFPRGLLGLKGKL